MATIATYKFDNSSDFENATSRISSEVGHYSYNGWNSSYSYYEIYIYDDCEKPALIGKICSAHGGKSC